MDVVEPVARGWQLITAALAAIALLVLLITIVKLHPFLALILGALTVGIVAGENVSDVLVSFTTGFGTTAAGVGALIALGAMFAKLLADSGGADQIVDTIVGRASPRMLPWAMAAVGAIIGVPMFFEIGLVLLMPVIYLVSRRAQVSLITVGIPALAGLSAMHGFVPPHPGPVIAIDYLGADLGVTLGLGLLVAVPTIVVAGPLFGIARRPVGPARGTAHLRTADDRDESAPAVVRRHHRDRAAAGRADARQGDRRHRHRRPGQHRPAGRRRDRQPVRGAADLGPGRDVHVRRRHRHGPRQDLRDRRRRAASDRRDPADRGRRRWLQAGAHRHRDRHPAGRLGRRVEHLGAAARLGARRPDPPRDRLGDRRHDHRELADGRAGRGPVHRRDLAAGARRSAPGRCSSPT